MSRVVSLSLSLFALAVLSSCGRAVKPVPREAEAEETHLRNVRQLTFVGQNAEAYFSGDGTQLIYQASECFEQPGGAATPECDQIYSMTLDGAGPDGSGARLVSTGRGRTTCAYFLPDGARIVYASTHLGGDACPPKPQFDPRRYVWPIYADYDIFSAKPDGSDLVRLTTAKGYDAEPTVAPDGSRIVFTSMRDGDLELYTMKPDGSDKRRVTSTPGYDGGAFFSPDSTRLCYRASRPGSPEELEKYQSLLERNLVEPSRLEIYVCDVDGTNVVQITSNGAANFCPFFHPSGEKLIYASNRLDPRKRNFDLFLIDVGTKEETRVTYHETFDGFPMFSPDGSKLVWCSNRFGANRGDTNVFLADWVE